MLTLIYETPTLTVHTNPSNELFISIKSSHVFVRIRDLNDGLLIVSSSENVLIPTAQNGLSAIKVETR